MNKVASVYTSTLTLLSCSVFAMAQSVGAPQPSTFTTLVTTPRSIEGLTGDNTGNLFLAASGAAPCPIWQVNLGSPSLVLVGNIPASLIKRKQLCSYDVPFLAASPICRRFDSQMGRFPFSLPVPRPCLSAVTDPAFQWSMR